MRWQKLMEADILQERLIRSVECVLAVYEGSRVVEAADGVLVLQQSMAIAYTGQLYRQSNP
jgi:hypothetical protein